MVGFFFVLFFLFLSSFGGLPSAQKQWWLNFTSAKGVRVGLSVVVLGFAYPESIRVAQTLWATYLYPFPGCSSPQLVKNYTIIRCPVFYNVCTLKKVKIWVKRGDCYVRAGIAVESPQRPERSERREDLQRIARPFAFDNNPIQVQCF